MSDSSRPAGCPSSDDLSVAADGSAPEEIAVHLEACPLCQRNLAVLRHIDIAIRRQMAPPSGLADGIRRRIGESVAKEPIVMPRRWLAPALRLAAAVVFSTAIVTVVAHLLGDGARVKPSLAANTTETEPATPLPTTPTPAAPPMDNSSLRLVARTGSGVLVGSGAGSEEAQCLPRMVRHIWTVSDAAAETAQLKKLLPQGAYDVSVEGGNTVFNVVLADRDLQALVTRLAERRWELVSPDLPQPQKLASLRLTGQDVRYRLVMVQH